MVTYPTEAHHASDSNAPIAAVIMNRPQIRGTVTSPATDARMLHTSKVTATVWAITPAVVEGSSNSTKTLSVNNAGGVKTAISQEVRANWAFELMGVKTLGKWRSRCVATMFRPFHAFPPRVV